MNEPHTENPGTARNDTCPSCGSRDLHPFHRVDGTPVHSVLLLQTRDAAVSYPCGAIELGLCRTCGFITNLAFDPALHEYSSDCEESQGFSPTFMAFHRRLAEHLIERYDLRGKEILEIGCGKGEFLQLLCELGGNSGVGFDPAYRSDRTGEDGADRVTFIKDFFSEKYADHHADFICCKMTLEHIQSTAEFVSIVRRSIGDRHRTTVFFQVPDVTRILEEVAFWDIYYEHCSYFSPGSLARLFRRCGFEVLDLWRNYGDQYLMIEARAGDGAPREPTPLEEDPANLARRIQAFQSGYRSEITTWNRFFQDVRAKHQRVVLWGSGSKAVGFLSTLGLHDTVDYVVDINPYRQGTFCAGTGQEIVPPASLSSYKPDVVIVMNPLYLEEIQRDLAILGLDPHVMAVPTLTTRTI